MLAAAVLAGVLGAAPAWAEPRSYTIDPEHFAIGFQVEHLGYADIIGLFLKASGRFEYDEAARTLKSGRVVVAADSVFSNHEARDRHVRDSDFLDARKHPEIVFEASGFDLDHLYRAICTSTAYGRGLGGGHETPRAARFAHQALRPLDADQLLDSIFVATDADKLIDERAPDQAERMTVGLVGRMTPQDALTFACAAGALATTRRGAQPSAPTRAEVDALLEDRGSSVPFPN